MIRIISEQKLESALEKVSDTVTQVGSYKLLNRETKKFTNKEGVEEDIRKHFAEDIKKRILSFKILDYINYYDKKVAKRYYTMAELAKAFTLLEDLRKKSKDIKD